LPFPCCEMLGARKERNEAPRAQPTIDVRFKQFLQSFFVALLCSVSSHPQCDYGHEPGFLLREQYDAAQKAVGLPVCIAYYKGNFSMKFLRLAGKGYELHAIGEKQRT